MANRPQQNRAEQDQAPNMKLIKPGEGGIHSAVGAPKTGKPQRGQEAWTGPQAGQNPRT